VICISCSRDTTEKEKYFSEDDFTCFFVVSPKPGIRADGGTFFGFVDFTVELQSAVLARRVIQLTC
jgi:hypothetical protein